MLQCFILNMKITQDPFLSVLVLTLPHYLTGQFQVEFYWLVKFDRVIWVRSTKKSKFESRDPWAVSFCECAAVAWAQSERFELEHGKPMKVTIKSRSEHEQEHFECKRGTLRESITKSQHEIIKLYFQINKTMHLNDDSNESPLFWGPVLIYTDFYKTNFALIWAISYKEVCFYYHICNNQTTASIAKFHAAFVMLQ